MVGMEPEADRAVVSASGEKLVRENVTDAEKHRGQIQGGHTSFEQIFSNP